MYRRLKNILGVSLMILAVVISQVPMPEAQAEIVKEMTEADMQVDDSSAHVVTFSMNGGTFNGNYNGYSFKDKTPVLVIDDGKTISSFPDNQLASYAGYRTEPDTWYTDKECLTKYDADARVTESTTLYKKWYNITSDGTTLAGSGFHISADRTVLYQYDGDDKNVEIPQTVTTIAAGAFDKLDQVRAVTLPAGIKKIEKNAFSGVKDGSIIYIYDSNTEDSKAYGKQLDEEYEQLVYSEYLDAEKTEKIAGIENLSDSSQEETPEVKEGTETGESIPTENKTEGNNTEESKTQESTSGESTPQESVSEESKPEESSKEESTPQESVSEESKPEESSTEESSKVIVIDPDRKYTVTFATGISDVNGEKREVLNGRTISELVSVNDEQPKILRKDIFQIEKDDGKQEIIYIFKGWYKDNAYTAEWDFANDVIEQDTTIYAKWDQETKAYFTVTYNTTEGNEKASNIPEKQKLYADEKLQKPSKKPSMKNKTFKGWYTSATDTKSAYSSWGKPVTQDLTLYAHFEDKSNTVVFHMNGGGFTGKYNDKSYTDTASLTQKITVGKGISSSEYPENSSSASFKYSNYSTDSNWYTDKECLDIYAKKDSSGKDTVLDGDLTLYKRWYYTSSGFTTNTSGNVLYKYSGSVADVTIPNSVTMIGSDAFASAGSISSITLPDNISEVKENAFSGVKNVSKDIIITGKSENARNVAKGLANQYTRLVYKDNSDGSDNSVVSQAASGSIKLGAAISGNAGTQNQTTTENKTTTSNNKSSGTIALGAGASTVTSVQSTVSQPTASQPATVSQPVAASQSTTVSQSVTSQPATGTQAAASGQNVTASAQKSSSGSSASVAQGAQTTQKSNVVSASAPRSTQHIKDATPKTGDPLQYRMLIVCAMFSVGVLLVLTGNGKKRKSSAS